MLLNILEQSFLFFPLTLGLYMSYVVLKTADLTTDGSFIVGATLFGLGITNGFDPIACMTFSLAGGALCGITAGFLQTRFHLHPLITGILLVFILNTLCLKLLGRPNLCLLDQPSIFSDLSKTSLLFYLTLIMLGSMSYLLSSKIGLTLHASGSNKTLLNLIGKNADAYRIFGLALSNALTALAGSLSAQASGFVDTSMGIGIVLIALGTVMIGEQIYKTFFIEVRLKHPIKLLCSFFGIITYFLLVHTLISVGLDPVYLRLMIGVCLIAFLIITRKKNLTEISV